MNHFSKKKTGFLQSRILVAHIFAPKMMIFLTTQEFSFGVSSDAEEVVTTA